MFSLLKFRDLFFLIFIVSVFSACRHSKQPKAIPININDTTYLKTVKWIPLNEFVSYHIIKAGKAVQDTSIHFSMEKLATRWLHKMVFDMPDTGQRLLPGELNKKDTLSFKPAELSQFILSTMFSNKESVDCILKVNSKIMYKLRPSLLKGIDVIPKALDKQNINILMHELETEKFTQNIVLKNNGAKALDTLFKRMIKSESSPVLFKVIVKPAYRNLKDLAKICSQLKLNHNIENAIYVSMFSDLTETDDFYRLTSAKK